ncbi:MAG TPA: hypothetical protein VJA84_01890, partial [Candidatus Omnitrophota bacterium]|nr:hypothetical protein [Candidatus Omnitrophota bacterium]
VFFSLVLSLTLSAQDYYKKQKPAPAQETRKEAVSEEKYKDLEKGQQAILKKLDQLLSGQEKILKELEIVKVRASKR